MASVNEARDVIGALEYQDHCLERRDLDRSISLKPAAIPTVQADKAANYWPELERFYRVLSLPLQWIGSHVRIK